MIYANENDKHAAHWLSCLPMRFDVIDDRSIKDVQGYEVEGYTQCHFFAGIGGWPLALKIACWPTDAPVWTGSCPCQPFSAAGKGRGVDDERHLWPEFRRLIDECRPSTIFGEQVASKAGRAWLATVRTDLEALGYAVGAADLCAASVGAPHIRQRLFWVAHCDEYRCDKGRQSVTSEKHDGAFGNSASSRLANARRERSDARSGSRRGLETGERGEFCINDKQDSGMGDAGSEGLSQRISERRMDRKPGPAVERQAVKFSGDASRLGDSQGSRGDRRIRCEPSEQGWNGSGMLEGPSHWGSVEFIPCSDGKARPVKPGVCLLAHGIPGRVAQLRGLGNAIVPEVAAEFIAAFMDSR